MSLDGNATAEHKEWAPEDVTFLVLYCCASVVGATANAFVIAAIARPGSRSRNDIVLSLCASDLLVCTVSMPLSLSTVLLQFWTKGLLLCKIAFYFQTFPVAASTASLTVLALDRYAIVKHSRLLSKLRPQHMIMLVWSGAAFVTSPILYAREVTFHQCREIWPSDQIRTAYILSHITIVYVIPCLAVASCHFSVGQKLCAAREPSLPLPPPLIRKPQHVIILASVLPHSPSKMVARRGSEELESSSGEAVEHDLKTQGKPQLVAGQKTKIGSSQSRIRLDQKTRRVPPLFKQMSRQSLHSRRRLASMLVAMVVVFAVCWAPYVAFKICSETGLAVPATVLSFCLLLGHTHSAINPLVYYLSNRQSLSVGLGCGLRWPWDKDRVSSGFRRPPPSSTNEAALGAFHPNYTTKRFQPRRGCTNDYL